LFIKKTPIFEEEEQQQHGFLLIKRKSPNRRQQQHSLKHQRSRLAKSHLRQAPAKAETRCSFRRQ